MCMSDVSQPSLFDAPSPAPRKGAHPTESARVAKAGDAASAGDGVRGAGEAGEGSGARVGRIELPLVQARTSLAAAATAFGEHLTRAGKTDNTRRAFLSDLRLLAEHAGADRPVGEFESDDLRAYLTWMREHRGRPCSAKTYARRLTSLKVFFAWLHERGAIAADPALPLIHRRAEPPLPLVLDDSQVARLLKVARRPLAAMRVDARPALLIRLLLDTALKKGEVARLRASDVAASGPDPSLLVRYDDPRWADKERRVEFSTFVAPLLEVYLEQHSGAERLFDCTARNLEYVLTELVEQADLPPRTSFETLRWTSATRAWRAGVEEDALREALGLSSITWVGTVRKLALLAGTTGDERVAQRWFPEPGPKATAPSP
jgi:integrase/recombinase XerD